MSATRERLPSLRWQQEDYCATQQALWLHALEVFCRWHAKRPEVVPERGRNGKATDQ